MCVLLPLTLATSAIGIYSLTATLFWGRVVFGIPFSIEQPFAFVVAVPATILGLGLLGLLFATTFVLYRHANALSNMLEWPVLLVTGMLVPLSLLPGWSHPIAWVLAPTWGVQAIRLAAMGNDVPSETYLPFGTSPWPYVAMTLAARRPLPRARDGVPRLLRARGPQAGDPLAHVRSGVRVFFVGGLIAYRALFNWIRPSMYIPTMLIGPIFQILFFAKLGSTRA